MQRLFSYTPLAQAIYYIFTGIWPLVHIQSFMAITGPKEDLWLVRIVGALVLSIGFGLLYGWMQHSITKPLVVLVALSALSLSAIDVIYVLNDTIRPVYLLDAVAEIILLIGYIGWWKNSVAS